MRTYYNEIQNFDKPSPLTNVTPINNPCLLLFIGDDTKIDDILNQQLHMTYMSYDNRTRGPILHNIYNHIVAKTTFFDESIYLKYQQQSDMKVIIAITDSKWKYKLEYIKQKYPEISLLQFNDWYSTEFIVNYINKLLGGKNG